MKEDTVYSARIYGLHTGDYKFRYVGYTVMTATQRLNGHKYAARKGGTDPVHMWIRKHRYQIHTEVIEELTGNRDEVWAAEIKWIAILDTLSNGLNCTAGGGGMLGFRHSEQTRTAIGAAHRGKITPEETKAKMRAAGLGRTINEESRKKMRVAWETRRQIPVSEETRQKMSEALRGRVVSEETRKKLSMANTGKIVSEQTREAQRRSFDKKYTCNDCGLVTDSKHMATHQNIRGHRGITDPGCIAPSPTMSQTHQTELAEARVKVSRWKCGECSLVTTPGSLGYHQGKSGHVGRTEATEEQQELYRLEQKQQSRRAERYSCDTCGLESSYGSVRRHQSVKGHTGATPVEKVDA